MKITKKQKTVLLIGMAVAISSIIGSTLIWSSCQKGNAPDFTVLNERGKSVQLSDYQGKPVVVNFWATWCGPCLSELQAFEDCR